MRFKKKQQITPCETSVNQASIKTSIIITVSISLIVHTQQKH